MEKKSFCHLCDAITTRCGRIKCANLGCDSFFVCDKCGYCSWPCCDVKKLFEMYNRKWKDINFLTKLLNEKGCKVDQIKVTQKINTLESLGYTVFKNDSPPPVYCITK